MLLRIATLFTFALALILSSCAPEHSQIVLAEFGNQKIKMGEFEKAYENNIDNVEQAKKDSLSKLKNFLNLYVDFRMKLRDAFVRGFDQDTSLQNELNNYKKEIGVTYLLDKKLVEPAIHKLYERRKWELRVSHIMIRPNSLGDKVAEEKANAILDSIKNGASFAEMAKKYSQDKYSAPEGGDIFYITAGELPPSFEDACYATEPGHVYPHVVKTRFGYHIIKVTDKRLRVPEIRGSHILASFNKDGKLDTAAAREKIDTVMAKLEAGGNFAELAREYSDDTGSKMRGGDLGYFQIRRMVKPFAEAAFNLKNIGDISGIVKTRFGYHIIKLTGKKPYPSFDDEKEALKRMYKQTRYQEQYDSLIASLRKKYNYKLNKDTFEKLVAVSDTLKVGQENARLVKIKDDTLFTYDGMSMSVGEFLAQLSKLSDFEHKKMTSSVIDEGISKISGNSLLDEDAMNLDKTDAKFADLMKHYKEGIYIFKLQQDEVWNKLKLDSTKLYDYYLKNKDKYVWPDRVNFAEIHAVSDSAIRFYYSLLQKGENFDSVAAKYTTRPGFKEKAGVWGLSDVNSSPLSIRAFKLKEPGDYTKPFPYQGGYSIVMLIEKDPSHIKTFEEAKAEVSGAYQEIESKKLENEYIESLDKLYKPKIFYNELDKAFKSN